MFGNTYPDGEHRDAKPVFYPPEVGISSGTACGWPQRRLCSLKTAKRLLNSMFRCRTIGDITCTGVTLSQANSLEDIIEEIAATRTLPSAEAVPTISDRRQQWKTEKKKAIFNGAFRPF
jgi:hypothetical protein